MVWPEPVIPVPPGLARRDQARFAEHPQVLRHRGLAHVQSGHQVGDGQVTGGKLLKQVPPGRIGQG